MSVVALQQEATVPNMLRGIASKIDSGELSEYDYVCACLGEDNSGMAFSAAQSPYELLGLLRSIEAEVLDYIKVLESLEEG